MDLNTESGCTCFKSHSMSLHGSQNFYFASGKQHCPCFLGAPLSGLQDNHYWHLLHPIQRGRYQDWVRLKFEMIIFMIKCDSESLWLGILITRKVKIMCREKNAVSAPLPSSVKNVPSMLLQSRRWSIQQCAWVAVCVAGGCSLFTITVIMPFLWKRLHLYLQEWVELTTACWH